MSSWGTLLAGADADCIGEWHYKGCKIMQSTQALSEGELK